MTIYCFFRCFFSVSLGSFDLAWERVADLSVKGSESATEGVTNSLPFSSTSSIVGVTISLPFCSVKGVISVTLSLRVAISLPFSDTFQVEGSRLKAVMGLCPRPPGVLSRWIIFIFMRPPISRLTCCALILQASANSEMPMGQGRFPHCPGCCQQSVRRQTAQRICHCVPLRRSLASLSTNQFGIRRCPSSGPGRVFTLFPLASHALFACE